MAVGKLIAGGAHATLTGERVLVVDDEHRIVEVVRAYLEREGFQVAAAATGAEALAALESFQPDLVVLDLMLPDVPGEEICRRIRGSSDVPVVMLTAKSTLDDVIHGLGLGADDYLTKPFSPRELAARVRAVLRRARRSPWAAGETVSFNGGALVLDPTAREARVHGRPVGLTRTEWELLEVLARHPGRVWTRRQLIERLRGAEFEGEDRTVDAHIKKLRAKLEDDPRRPRFVITVWGVGYKFGGRPDA